MQLRDAVFGHAAHPRIFVVYPHVHPEGSGLLKDVPDGGKPLLGQIRSDQAGTGVHHRPEDVLLVHLPHLPLQALRVELLVQEPERHRPVLEGGFVEAVKYAHLRLSPDA